MVKLPFAVFALTLTS